MLETITLTWQVTVVYHRHFVLIERDLAKKRAYECSCVSEVSPKALECPILVEGSKFWGSNFGASVDEVQEQDVLTCSTLSARGLVSRVPSLRQ